MKTGKIVWEINGQSIDVKVNLPFALLNKELQTLKKSPQYAKGKLTLKYYSL